jgi:hypothetical protein
LAKDERVTRFWVSEWPFQWGYHGQPMMIDDDFGGLMFCFHHWGDVPTLRHHFSC